MGEEKSRCGLCQKGIEHSQVMTHFDVAYEINKTPVQFSAQFKDQENEALMLCKECVCFILVSTAKEFLERKPGKTGIVN